MDFKVALSGLCITVLTRVSDFDGYAFCMLTLACLKYSSGWLLWCVHTVDESADCKRAAPSTLGLSSGILATRTGGVVKVPRNIREAHPAQSFCGL